MERLMDLVAGKLGLDAAEVRLANMIRPEQMPYAVGITFRDGRPVTYDSGDYPACQAKALALADYAGFARRQAGAAKSGRHIGIGISNSVEATGLGPYEGATVRVLTNGRIAVHVGGPSQGQGHKTAFAQIAAGHFGVGIDAVEVMSGDTASIAYGHGTFGARMAVTAGSSVHVAAAEVARQVKALAAEMLEVPEAELELQGGRVQVKGLPEQPHLRRNMEGMGLGLRELAVRSVGQSGIAMRPGSKPGLESTAYFTPERSTYANGTHVVEVEVDIETGEVKILRYVVVHDCGRVINPLIVNGQIVGGIAHGIGNALLERMVYDADAQPLSTNFGEYMLPLATDVPHLEISHMETPSPLNPIGVKGVGEGGTILAMAAVIGAVDNALAPFGVRIREAPISPQRIVELLNEARAGRAAAPSRTTSSAPVRV
jgi:carbon-monoxide dehydrogenase large subunit